MMLTTTRSGWAGATAAEPSHPRLFFGPRDIGAIRRRARLEPYRSVIAELRRRVGRMHEGDGDRDVARPMADPSDRIYDDRPRDLATLYVVTGDRTYAAQAEQICLGMVETDVWNSRSSKGLTRAMGAVTVAIAYDLCHEAWAVETRERVSEALYRISRTLGQSMGRGANTSLANNWAAVRYAGMGLAGLAGDHDQGVDQARWAYPWLVRHLQANLGDNGWNPEGIGYTIYPWTFTGPFGVAAKRAGIGDLTEDVGHPARMTLWTTVVGTVNVPTTNGRRGLRADLSDDHPQWTGHGTLPTAFRFLPESHRGPMRWMYDYLVGERGGGDWDATRGGALYSILFLPEDVEPINPGDAVGLNYADRSAGVAIFRNRYQDEDDIVAVVNARQRHPRGCHGGADTNTFRIQGLGGFFVTGAGRTDGTAGQTNLFAGHPPQRGRGLGELVEVRFDPATGSGDALLNGSCLGVNNHTRRFAVDYRGDCGAPAMFVDAETSDNGKRWRLNTPWINDVSFDGRRFTLTGPNGATLAGTVIQPAEPNFRTGVVERGGGMDHAAFQYHGNKYADNRFLEFDCDGDVLVVMTMQRGEPPAVRGDGAARQARFRVGRVDVIVSPEGIAVAGLEPAAAD